MFAIGERVICVDDSMLPDTVEELKKDVPNWVKKDQIYTVRGLLDNNGIVLGLLLEEIKNPSKYFRLINRIQEPAFKLDRFRKLEKTEAFIEKEEEIYISL